MKTMIAVLASVFLISSAFAQSMAPSASAGDAKRDMKLEMHIKDLHAKLKITPAEETQWAAVAQTMRDSAKELDDAIDKREATINTATAIDNLNAYGDIAQAHTDSVKKLSAAFAPLYASMPDDQKMIADEVFASRPHKAMKASDTTKY
jgi:periplasmic protein CpxP/Spy